jgi:O-antigen biosynthesis protein
MNWFIVSPPYRHTSAGIRVMHRLCHKLNALGENAYISTPKIEGTWNTPFKKSPEIDDIVVYPEITCSNPLNAKYVVRYVLYYPGFNGGDKKYNNSELVIYYDEKYRIGPGPVIWISPVNEEMFYNTGEKKTIDLVFIGKGDRSSAPWPMSAIEITSNWPKSRYETIELIRKAKAIYSYDIHTSVLIEAYLCEARIWTPINGIWGLYDWSNLTLLSWDNLTETKRLVDLTKAYFAL